jgi:hypothetical protein
MQKCIVKQADPDVSMDRNAVNLASSNANAH